jgi:hypothetical protein
MTVKNYLFSNNPGERGPSLLLSRRLLVFGITAFFLVAPLKIGSADCPPCGPLYCLDTPEYQATLAQKKAALTRQGYPARLVALVEKIDHCKGCIDTSPDGFSLFTVGLDGSILIKAWTSDDEGVAAKAVANGTSKSCYVIFSRRACAGCKQPKYMDRSDYDASLDLNKKATITCQSTSPK